MTEQEGVIKYQLVFEQKPCRIREEDLESLNLCRTKLVQYGMIGQDDLRYEGYGFGNLSIRDEFSSDRFIVSGSQTGEKASLAASDLASVIACNPTQNTLRAIGLTQPSSEAMTHGVIYRALPMVNAVVHVHSPDIWRNAQSLGLPVTPKEVAYGTPDMAAVVCSLASEQRDLPFLFVMKGHEDGVVAAGKSLLDCQNALLHAFEQAIRF